MWKYTIFNKEKQNDVAQGLIKLQIKSEAFIQNPRIY